MRRLIRQSENKTGFTIVELLTVMSIIIILIGVLVPSLNMVNRYAKDVKQKTQFHSIETALELFKGDFDGYPDSSTPGLAAGYDEDGQCYPGAARLCEAMVGQDLLGFHPWSHFRADCTIDGTNKIYSNPSTVTTLYPADNLQARKGPYLQVERANAYKIKDIYNAALFSGAGLGNDFPEVFVLCDEYGRVRHTTKGKRIGMPVLYYKANTAGTKYDPNVPSDTANIYNYIDNHPLVEMGIPGKTQSYDGDPKHPMNTPRKFYDETLNPKIEISTTGGRPYRLDSYILLSAGFDGQYGTPDDIFNFEKE